MFKAIAAQFLLGLTLTLAVPLALEAQQSARIGVSARVVGSAVPETHAATTSELSRLAESCGSNTNMVRHAMATERGIAQVITERLPDSPEPVRHLTPAITDQSSDYGAERVMITVAFTAN